MFAGSAGEALKWSQPSSDTSGHTQRTRLMGAVSVAEASARCRSSLIIRGHTQGKSHMCARSEAEA
ncbi:unnamed protein product, partial [Gulo gulo]